jgi:hypothetical protein
MLLCCCDHWWQTCCHRKPARSHRNRLKKLNKTHSATASLWQRLGRPERQWRLTLRRRRASRSCSARRREEFSATAHADRAVRKRQITSYCRCCSSSSRAGTRTHELNEFMQRRADPLQGPAFRRTSDGKHDITSLANVVRSPAQPGGDRLPQARAVLHHPPAS